MLYGSKTRPRGWGTLFSLKKGLPRVLRRPMRIYILSSKQAQRSEARNNLQETEGGRDVDYPMALCSFFILFIYLIWQRLLMIYRLEKWSWLLSAEWILSRFNLESCMRITWSQNLPNDLCPPCVPFRAAPFFDTNSWLMQMIPYLCMP